MAVGTSDATVLMIASMAMEAGGVKKSPSASSCGRSAMTFYPHGGLQRGKFDQSLYRKQPF